MEITRANFREKLPEILSDISKSRFLSFDQEFTGLSTDNTRNPYATLEEFYLSHRKKTDGFVVVQFGLTCFWLENGKYLYKSYNFYVYPRGRRHVFLCEGEAVSFLAKNNFDFNKLFKEGISYCDVIEAKKLKEKISERQGKRAEVLESGVPDTTKHIIIPDKEEGMINKVCEDIDEFLKDTAKEELQVENLNGFQRRLIYQTIESKYFNSVAASTSNSVMILKRKDDDEQKKLEEEKCKKEQEYLEDQIGMTTLIQAISESKKLIIGHNIFLDVLFLMRQFFGPLPENYLEYKSSVHQAFPYLLDTKYLCSTDQIKTKIPSSVLSDVLAKIQEEPFQIPEYSATEKEFSYSLSDDKQHEAGYDAFICGIAFLTIVQSMEIDLKDVDEKCAKLRPLMNKIFIMNLTDINFMNLYGKDAQVKRDHVFHITFPASWKQNDIVNKFKHFGPVQISYQNDTSAYVALHQREFATAAFKALQNSTDMKIKPYFDLPVQNKENGDSTKRKTVDLSPSGVVKKQKKEIFTTDEDGWTKV